MDLKSIALDASDQRIYRLKDFRGTKLILVVYPKNSRGSCLQMLKRFDALSEDFRHKGYIIVGMNREPLKRHADFKADNSIDLLLVSDKDEQLSRALGLLLTKEVFDKRITGLPRAALIFDEQTNLISKEINIDPEHYPDALLNRL